MTRVYTEAHNIISPLGFHTSENITNILKGETGIAICKNKGYASMDFPASTLNNEAISEYFNAIGKCNNYTRFEKIAILSIFDALSNSKISATSPRTLLILSTTKGNIELLDKNVATQFSDNRLYLDTAAQVISDFFHFKTKPIVVSNACISGVAAIIMAQRLIKNGIYDNVVVNGTDVLSKFIVSGFQSFMALSNSACKPFDADRNGLTLGEGSATLILTREMGGIEVASGAISNDANHISGPSRTGEGLFIAINKTMAGYKNVDLISAHGTATIYNDDMESVAIARSGLNKIPVNSLKGYYGHTLGAAGVIESIVNLESIKRGVVLKTLGCKTPNTIEKINVSLSTLSHDVKSMLKLSSGFGGCNAAALFIKHE
jgi:3-oxoacyl-[acyl-carrier-protein] synthase-1